MEGTINFESSIDILKILKDTRFDEIKVKTEDKPSFSETSKNTSYYENRYNELYLSYLPTEKDRKTKVIQKLIFKID